MGYMEGKVAVVTGGGRGLGREESLLLAREGAKLVVNDFGGEMDGSGAEPGPADEVVSLIREAGGEAMAKEGSIAKVFCTEMATRVTQSAMQVMGGQSYLMESDVQRWARMAMLGPIGMGTNNIQRLIIASNLGLG